MGRAARSIGILSHFVTPDKFNRMNEISHMDDYDRSQSYRSVSARSRRSTHPTNAGANIPFHSRSLRSFSGGPGSFELDPARGRRGTGDVSVRSHRTILDDNRSEGSHWDLQSHTPPPSEKADSPRSRLSDSGFSHAFSVYDIESDAAKPKDPQENNGSAADGNDVEAQAVQDSDPGEQAPCTFLGIPWSPMATAISAGAGVLIIIAIWYLTKGD